MAFDPNDEVTVTLKVRQWNLVMRLLRDLVQDPQDVIQAISDQAQAEDDRRARERAKLAKVQVEAPEEAAPLAPPINLAAEKVKRPARGASAEPPA